MLPPNASLGASFPVFNPADTEAKGAAFEDRLLKIELVRKVPEAIKPRRIAIKDGNREPTIEYKKDRPIWFGGKDRSETSMSEFYAWLGEKNSRRIRLAVMDMWKPFRLATQAHGAGCAGQSFHGK
jgi:hypothetical protein